MKAPSLSNFLLGNEKAAAEVERRINAAVKAAVKAERNQARAIDRETRAHKKAAITAIKAETEVFKFATLPERKAAKAIATAAVSHIRTPPVATPEE